MKYTISTRYDGIPRKVYSKACKSCGKLVWVPNHRLKSTKFCSLKCFRFSRSKSKQLKCWQCGQTFRKKRAKLKTKRGINFCSRACKDFAQQIGEIFEQTPNRSSRQNYRTKALKKHGAICKLCEYDKHIEMLDVHHIDGDHANHNISNLQVLCVWCHSLKTRKIKWHTWQSGSHQSNGRRKGR